MHDKTSVRGIFTDSLGLTWTATAPLRQRHVDAGLGPPLVSKDRNVLASTAYERGIDGRRDRGCHSTAWRRVEEWLGDWSARHVR
jgi:hypothetical protein